MTTDSQDDKVLEQLYKKGAKESPPVKLNYEIIKYAANADNSTETPSQVGSHFGGGWKVPLSMAASVVVVFALLIQLDQSPEDLELPPIPEITIPTESKSVESKDQTLESQIVLEETYEVEEATLDDIAPSFKNDAKELDIDSEGTGALVIDIPVQTESPIPIKRNADKNDEQKLESSGDRAKTRQTIEKSKTSDEFRIQSNEPKPASTASTSSPSSTTPKSDEEYAPQLAKPQAAQKKVQEPARGGELDDNSSETPSGSVLQQKSMSKGSIIREDSQTSSDLAADTELGDEEVQTEEIIEDQVEGEFAPIPVDDWLLMIERLVAKKDYAEAARQLEKFKQAHPKVNVEDLDTKIP